MSVSRADLQSTKGDLQIIFDSPGTLTLGVVPTSQPEGLLRSMLNWSICWPVKAQYEQAQMLK
jgi:hypothetical protein